MAITRKRKEQLVAEYAEKLGRSAGVLLTENNGMDVQQFDSLRAILRDADAEFHVAKNSLIGLALKEAGYEIPEEMLLGPTAVTFAYNDVAATAKALLKWADASDEKLAVKGGAIGAQALDKAEVKALSELPPLEEVRATLLGLLNQPATKLVRHINTPGQQLAGVMGAGTRQLVNVLNAYAQKEAA